MDKPKRAKKPNKAAREKRKAERAEIYEQGFNHGYTMGFAQGSKQTAEQMQRNVLKFAHRGQ
jgi:flagellar biosynthesis/type III secretory pathway protein FliH